jgi:hypothetical protein
MKLATGGLLLVLPARALAWQLSAPADTVAYPEGYRDWVHVKSALVSPAHPSFATNGGFQHIYANSQGMVGYRTRAFPEGSIVVFDWLEMRDNKGAFEETARRQVDVMVTRAERMGMKTQI